jgi:hypothetical protein
LVGGWQLLDLALVPALLGALALDWARRSDWRFLVSMVVALAYGVVGIAHDTFVDPVIALFG